jgi:hypothetical protein
MTAKKLADGYTGKMTWAVVVAGDYGDEVIECGFSTKRDAMAWIANQK